MEEKQYIDSSSNKYYNMSNDYLFKGIMNHKESMKYLLETCFDIKLNECKMSNVELIKDHKIKKMNIIDFKIEDKRNIYLVEMQNKNKYNMSERWMYSFSRQCQLELTKNEEYKKIRKITFLIFENYENYKEEKYQLLGNKYKELFTDKVEIKVFNIQREEKNKKRKNIVQLFQIQSKEELEKLKLNEKEEKIRQMIKKYNVEKDELKEIERMEEEMNLFDIGLYNAREEGKKEGKSQGRKEGKKEGKREGKREKTFEIAMNMIQKKIDFSLISELTGLSLQELEKIKNTNNDFTSYKAS